jgi:hypothetical protein
MTLLSSHLLQVNGVDGEVFDGFVVVHDCIYVRFDCKISIFYREKQTKKAGIVQIHILFVQSGN